MLRLINMDNIYVENGKGRVFLWLLFRFRSVVSFIFLVYSSTQGKEVSFLFPVDLFWWVVAFLESDFVFFSWPAPACIVKNVKILLIFF